MTSISPRFERIRIVSPELRRAITAVATCYTDEGRPTPGGELEMEAPYLFLFHHRHQLAALCDESNDRTREHAQVLSEFITNYYEEEYTEAEELFSRGVVTKTHFEKLFKPNETVITSNIEEPEAHVLSNWPTLLDDDVVQFSAWSFTFDGLMLTRKRKDWLGFHIILRGLPWEETIGKLLARGRKFWSMRRKHFACYTGWDAFRDHYYENTRLVIDTFTYRRMHEYPEYDSGRVMDPDRFDTWPHKILIDEEIDGPNLMLLPRTLRGFDLDGKKWVMLNVEQVHSVVWNKKAFDRLVLDPKSKELINALVAVKTSKARISDIISGKGNGLIILLHGSPGTGKTLTAESVAELAEKPLYSVTCGDIGTDPQQVEKYLETVLYLGKIWDCVLLLDEADVFLEERTMADLQRNSLVSVFLRTLEYYEGILILTSNRVGTFDEAFKSQIQVAIRYEALTKKSRKQVWQNFFDMFEETSEDFNFAELEGRLDELAAEEMNGRQIRNALLTARQLAIHRKERLGWEHLAQVMKTAADFNQYLKSVHGHSDEHWAREEHLR